MWGIGAGLGRCGRAKRGQSHRSGFNVIAVILLGFRGRSVTTMPNRSAPFKRNCLTGRVRKSHVLAMARQLPPLNALRAFEAAGRHQSFSGAAQELGVSHSAVSRHVRGLEDRLGAQLFRDLPRGVELTEAGAQYLVQITPALDAIAEASEVFSDKPAGLVTVDSEPLFAAKWLIPRLGAFYDRYPEVELRLDARRELADIQRYQADMALRFYHGTPPDADQPLLCNAPLYPYAVPEIAAQIAAPEDLLKFRRYRDRYDHTWGLWAAAAGLDPALFPEGPFRLRATLAIEAALAGHGVFLGSWEIVGNDVAAGRLVRVSDICIRHGRFHMVIGPGVLRRAPVRVFRDWLLEAAAELRDQN